MVVVVAAIGLAAVRSWVSRRAAGIVVSLLFWALGQSLGGLWTGQATDPNTAPLMVLLALAMMAWSSAAPVFSGRRPRSPEAAEA
jgi:hypothetical protein